MRKIGKTVVPSVLSSDLLLMYLNPKSIFRGKERIRIALDLRYRSQKVKGEKCI